MTDIWILGATGRTGRIIAAKLAAQGVAPVLVGRDEARLRELARRTGENTQVVVAASVEATVEALERAAQSGRAPAVVVNTIGPFAETAVPLAKACPPGTHYVDISNELHAIAALLALHEVAAASNRTFVAAAGFGVLATESVVMRLCEGQPPAARVRVDAIAAVDVEPGHIGTALAATVLDGVAGGGGRYEGGRLVAAPAGGDVERLTLPDGTTVETASIPTGDLEAAHRASGAPIVVAANSAGVLPPLARAIVPAAGALLRYPAVRRLATRLVARIPLKAQERSRAFSWTRARVEWPSGVVRDGWLRAGEATDFTAAVTAGVALRLARGEGRPGAYTPGALFGPDLAVEAGGQFILGPEPA